MNEEELNPTGLIEMPDYANLQDPEEQEKLIRAQQLEDAAEMAVEQPEATATEQPEPEPEQPDSNQTDRDEAAAAAHKPFWSPEFQKYHGYNSPNSGVGNMNRALEPLGQGLIDFTTDLLNHIPNVNLPKRAPYNSKVKQTVREISSLVLPMIYTRQAIGGKVSSLQAAKFGPESVQALGRNSLFKWFADWGLDIGIGVGVDKIAKIQETDHNLFGSLKKSWPETWSWIPHNWATNDEDSPDVKEAKNINEGIAFGTVGHFVSGLAKLSKASSSINRATKWVPQNETATDYFNRVPEVKSIDIKPGDVVEQDLKNATQGLNLDAELDEAALFGQNATEATTEARLDQMLENTWEDFKSQVANDNAWSKPIKDQLDHLQGKVDELDLEVRDAMFGPDGSRMHSVDDTPEIRALKDAPKPTEEWIASKAAERQAIFRQMDEIVDSARNEKAILSENPLEDTLLKGQVAQEAALDELGAFHKATETDLDQPLKGVHDLFDANELGLRSVDLDGVPGVTVDAVRIAKNIDSQHGALGSIFSEAALREGLQPHNLTKRTLVKSIVNHIKNSGEYKAILASGKEIKWSEIDAAGTKLAALMVDPLMEPGMLKATLKEFKDMVRGVEAINDVGYDAAFKSINHYLDEYLSMDVLKAQGYINSSLAGQVSGLAQGARLAQGTAAVEAAQEQILKRLEYLMVEKGITSWQRGAGLANINVWKRIRVLNDPDALDDFAKKAAQSHADQYEKIIPKVRETIESLENIRNERPEFLEPLLLAYEFSDGNINTMHKLNDAVEQSLQVWKKAFIDQRPEMPSVVMGSVWSNYFNSVLSASATNLRAAVGNAGGLLGKVIAPFAGALLHRDLEVVKYGFAQHAAIGDTLEKSLTHWNKVFRKAAFDPSTVSYIALDDVKTIQSAQKLEMLNSFAEAASQRGEDGPKYLMQRVNDMEGIANSPWFRYGANGMTASDGFTKAAVANWKARGDIWLDASKEGNVLTKEQFREASNELYENMFNKKGFIDDPEVIYASQEIALNLDNAASDAMSGLIKHIPAIRGFVLFPKTLTNMGQVFHRWGPTNMLAGDFAKIVRRPIDTFSIGEIEEILASKNIPLDQHAIMRFKTLRAEITGKVAIGSFLMTGAFNMAMNDRIHGNGHWDAGVQRSRGPKWQKRAFKDLNGNWHSGEFLGPLGDWMFLAADLVDNFDQISEAAIENTAGKLMYVLAASLTGKSVLSNLEPMLDVLQGNPYAANRWAANSINAAFPFAGARNELNKLIAPELRVLDLDVFGQLRNKNNWLDIIDKANKIPDQFDWVDGDKIGEPKHWFTRARNAFTPFRTTGKLSPEKQFLVDIEFDARPILSKSSGGIKYTPEEQSELLSMIGQDGHFKQTLRYLMQRAKRVNFVARMKEFRRKGISSSQVDVEKWEGIHLELDAALRQSMKFAEHRLSTYDRIKQAEFEKKQTIINNRLGNMPQENNPLTMRNK